MKIALVGRPNVGKSSLFNAISKKRISIVDEKEGVTMDRIYASLEFFGRGFELIDTGGISDNIDVREQAMIAIEEADVILQVVDGRVGVTLQDRDISRIVLRSKKRAVLVVNKVDDIGMKDMVWNFLELGFSDIFAVSATQRRGIDEVLECAIGEGRGEIREEEEAVEVAIVGAANVGKSTLLNSILDEKRAVVSEKPGTTRDSVSGRFVFNKRVYSLIDTAGIRRKKKEKEAVEKFSYIRTREAIERAKVVILVVDAMKGLTGQDKKIFSYIEKIGKGALIFLNKWDLVGSGGKRVKRECEEEIWGYPVLLGSALENMGLGEIFLEVEGICESLEKRVSTPLLNRFIEECLSKYSPPMVLGKRLKIYYLTQIGSGRFSLFVNRKDLMNRSYERYLVNSFRKRFEFFGVPVNFKVRAKGDGKGFLGMKYFKK